MSRKIHTKEFAAIEKKSLDAVYRLFKKHPRLKCKVEGERGYRVNMDVWERILKEA